jgi:hypothetical protein
MSVLGHSRVEVSRLRFSDIKNAAVKPLLDVQDSNLMLMDTFGVFNYNSSIDSSTTALFIYSKESQVAITGLRINVIYADDLRPDVVSNSQKQWVIRGDSSEVNITSSTMSNTPYYAIEMSSTKLRLESSYFDRCYGALSAGNNGE